MKPLAVATVAAIALAGCASVPPPNTPSGKLEFTLDNIDAGCVRSELANTLASTGFSIKSMSDYQIVVGRKAENSMAAFLLSTPAGGNPEERVTLTLIPQSSQSALRVIWEAAYVSNAGTAYESFQPIGASQANQNQLAGVESKLEAKCANTGS